MIRANNAREFVSTYRYTLTYIGLVILACIGFYLVRWVMKHANQHQHTLHVQPFIALFNDRFESFSCSTYAQLFIDAAEFAIVCGKERGRALDAALDTCSSEVLSLGSSSRLLSTMMPQRLLRDDKKWSLAYSQQARVEKIWHPPNKKRSGYYTYSVVRCAHVETEPQTPCTDAHADRELYVGVSLSSRYTSAPVD